MGRYAKESMWRRKEMMILYSSFLFLISLSIVLMPIANDVKSKSYILLYFAGACFWIGLVGVVYMLLKINRKRRDNYRFNESFNNQKQLGIIHFFQNTEALITDVIMFMSLVGFVITKIFSSNLYISFIISAVFIFSFGMHCMLNGTNYKYLKFTNYVKEQKKDE